LQGFLFYKLFLYGSANRACACTATAANALICVDYVLAVTLGNATGGACISASAAGDAFIGNLVSHCKYLHKKLFQIYSITFILKIKRIFQKSEKEVKNIILSILQEKYRGPHTILLH
jgi:hypothetical protein